MKVLKIILINILIFFLLIILLEIAVRQIPSHKVLLPFFNTSEDLPQFAPGIQIKSPTGSIANFNDQGWRVDLNDCTQEKEIKKVLLLGDSNIAARLVSNESAPNNVLERLLNKDNKYCYDVDNAGVGGFGPDQSVLLARKIVKNQTYDHVILHLFADNDLGDVFRNRYKLNNDQLVNSGFCYDPITVFDKVMVLKGLNEISKRILNIDLKSEQNRFGLDCAKAIESSSRFNSVPWDTENFKGEALMEYFQVHVDVGYELHKNGFSQHWIEDPYDIDFACNNVKPAKEGFISHHLSAMFDELMHLQKNGVNLVLLLQPSEFDVTNNHVVNSNSLKQFCDKYQPENISSYLVARIHESNLGASLVNLFDDFKGCNDCYFSELEISMDNHWNEKGIELAMSKLAEKILRDDLSATY